MNYNYRYDVDEVRYYSRLDKDIEDWFKNNGDSYVFVLHSSQRPRSSACDALRLDVGRLSSATDIARGVKDEHEIQLIRRANEISAQAHTRVFENIGAMSNETEIEAQFLDVCVSNDAKHQAYEIIAGSGENASVLHYLKNDEPLKGRQLVCLDAGAEWECYASDVTRTFPLGGGDWPSVEAEKIYKLVEEIQEECIASVRIGVGFIDLQTIAQEGVIRGLIELGILKGGDFLELFMSGVGRVFLPHGIGHHLGLEVHDVAGARPSTITTTNAEDPKWAPVTTSFIPWSAATLLPPFEEGMVITVEPGIYFSRYALADAKKRAIAKYIDFEVAERYIPIGGVRIEDDILITAHGYENLTTTPKGEKMLEIIRRGSEKARTEKQTKVI